MRDSEAPENFLKEPDPIKSLPLVVEAIPPILKRPEVSYTAADVAVAPLNVNRIPSPSGGATTVNSDPVPVKENRSCLSSGL